jgi:hypothetical protein
MYEYHITPIAHIDSRDQKDVTFMSGIISKALSDMDEQGWEFVQSSVVSRIEYLYFRRFKNDPELRLEKVSFVELPQKMVAVQN